MPLAAPSRPISTPLKVRNNYLKSIFLIKPKGIGARAFGGRGGGFGGGASGGVNPKDEMCSLPWMKNAKICQEGARRRRRSVSAGMSVGFGPVVLPEDQSVANERPSGEHA